MMVPQYKDGLFSSSSSIYHELAHYEQIPTYSVLRKHKESNTKQQYFTLRRKLEMEADEKYAIHVGATEHAIQNFYIHAHKETPNDVHPSSATRIDLLNNKLQNCLRNKECTNNEYIPGKIFLLNTIAKASKRRSQSNLKPAALSTDGTKLATAILTTCYELDKFESAERLDLETIKTGLFTLQENPHSLSWNEVKLFAADVIRICNALEKHNSKAKQQLEPLKMILKSHLKNILMLIKKASKCNP